MNTTMVVTETIAHAALAAARKMFASDLDRMPIAGADGFFVGRTTSAIPAGAERAQDMEVDGKTFVVFMEH